MPEDRQGKPLDDRIELKQLENEWRAELQPIQDERLIVHNFSLRPMYIKNGHIEYGPWPPEVQAYLEHLDELAAVIASKYEKAMSSYRNSMFMHSGGTR